MVQANTGIYNLLRPQKSAFDYFLQGQQARQQHDMNTQVMGMREQAMQQQAAMNPLLLRAQQLGIDTSQEALSQSQAMNPKLLAEAENTLLRQQQTYDQSAAAEEQLSKLRPGEIEQQEATLAQSQASTRLTDQQTNTALYNLKTAKKNAKSAEAKAAIEKTIANISAIGGYAEQGKNYPEGSLERAQFVQRLIPQLEKMGVDPAALSKAAQDGVTDKEFDQFISLKQGLQQSGEFEQVKDMPGVAFNKNTGTYTATPDQMKKAVEISESTKGKFDGKTIRDVTNDLRSTTKPARESFAAANKLLALGDEATPVDQIAAMYSFIKSLDPGGVVTDREGGMLSTSEGAFQGIVNLYNKAIGEGNLKNLMPQIKATAVKMANSQIESTRSEVASILDIYSGNKNITESQRKNFSALVPKTIDYLSPKEKEASKGESIPGGQQRIKLTLEEVNSL